MGAQPACSRIALFDACTSPVSVQARSAWGSLVRNDVRARQRTQRCDERSARLGLAATDVVGLARVALVDQTVIRRRDVTYDGLITRRREVADGDLTSAALFNGNEALSTARLPHVPVHDETVQTLAPAPLNLIRHRTHGA